MKVIAWLARISVFAVLAMTIWFCILAVNLVVVPLAIESLTGIAHPAGYKPTVTFPAVVVILLSIAALFRSIILKKSVKTLLIALTFYIGCNAVATLMIIIGENDLAPIFEWVGLIGLGLYFLIIKPLKRRSVESLIPN